MKRALPTMQQLPWRKAAQSLALVFALFYLCFHAISGERGFYAWLKETRKLTIMRAELEQLKAEREEYERKIRLMSPSSLDLDMLDEQTRRVLGFVGKDEVVVFDTDK